MERYPNKRMMLRQRNGRFRKPSLEQDFGLRTAVCPCGALNPYSRAAPVYVGRFIDPMSLNRWDKPATCARCGEPLA